jgi:hypothetical protein
MNKNDDDDNNYRDVSLSDVRDEIDNLVSFIRDTGNFHIRVDGVDNRINFKLSNIYKIVKVNDGSISRFKLTSFTTIKEDFIQFIDYMNRKYLVGSISVDIESGNTIFNNLDEFDGLDEFNSISFTIYAEK